jgi:hypothetical protein
MAKFTVTRPEIHLCYIEIEADSKEDALAKVKEGEGQEGQTDFLRSMEPYEFDWDVEDIPEEE